MKKDADGFLDLGQSIDPAVDVLLGQGRLRQEGQRMGVGERRKKRKEREKQAARKGRQALYDLEQDVKEGVAGLADELGTTASQVANALLALGLDAVRAGRVDLAGMRVPSSSPRYDFTLKVR